MIKNTRGQISVEIIIMLAVLVVAAVTISAGFRQSEVFANLVSSPWRSLAGLIQNGVWGTPEDTALLHPSHMNRVTSVRGELAE